MSTTIKKFLTHEDISVCTITPVSTAGVLGTPVSLIGHIDYINISSMVGQENVHPVGYMGDSHIATSYDTVVEIGERLKYGASANKLAKIAFSSRLVDIYIVAGGYIFEAVMRAGTYSERYGGTCSGVQSFHQTIDATTNEPNVWSTYTS